MKKSIKVALSLIAAGLILMAIGFFSGGFKSVFIDSNGNKKNFLYQYDIVKTDSHLLEHNFVSIL